MNDQFMLLQWSTTNIALRLLRSTTAPWIDTKKISPSFSIKIFYFLSKYYIYSHTATFTLLTVIGRYRPSRETLTLRTQFVVSNDFSRSSTLGGMCYHRASSRANKQIVYKNKRLQHQPKLRPRSLYTLFSRHCHPYSVFFFTQAVSHFFKISWLRPSHHAR